MPYTSIHWIKLEKRLLNDYRFYTMSDAAQLIYLKILMLAAETGNKIPKNPEILRDCFRSKLMPEQIQKCLEEIKVNFPKFISHNGFYQFEEWGARHNQVYPTDIPRISRGYPTELPDKIRKDKKRKSVSLLYHNSNKEKKHDPVVCKEVHKFTKDFIGKKI